MRIVLISSSNLSIVSLPDGDGDGDGVVLSRLRDLDDSPMVVSDATDKADMIEKAET